MSNPFTITMLGNFSITRDGITLDDTNNRMRKVWLLMAYLVHTRRTHLPIDALLSMVHSASGESEDPSGRLKALFYRARTMLDTLGPGTGHDLIIHRDGSYAWNPDVPVVLDVEEFDRLCTTPFAESGDTRLACFLEALELYRGDFLPKLSMEAWVMPITAYYHQRFLDAAMAALTILQERQRWEDATVLCQKALAIEPYSEDLYQHMMRCHMATGNRAAAVSAYETMSQLLYDEFGVMPTEKSRELYREATREANDQSVPAETVRTQLVEAEAAPGAIYCEYDFFKFLYQVQARSIVRTGDCIHIALLTLHGNSARVLARRSLDRAMENLKSLIITNLRQGDVVTRCSPSQLIVMLPQANFENSCMVCQRIIKAFYRQYPHSPTQIHFSVHPLEPTIPEPRKSQSQG